MKFDHKKQKHKGYKCNKITLLCFCLALLFMALYITSHFAFNFHLCFLSPKLNNNNNKKLKTHTDHIHKNMRTRRGLCYPRLVEHDLKHNNNNSSNTSMLFFTDNENNTTKILSFDVKRRRMEQQEEDENRDFIHHHNQTLKLPCVVSRNSKRLRKSPESGGADFFDVLPDDLVISIMTKLSASASCPSDFINVLITCKRLKGLALQSSVLSKASQKTFSIKAKNWSESAHSFFRLCAESGNIEACYTLGMIRFYCLQQRGSGASLMAKAAIASHAQALYSLAIIQFNGSGGTKNDKDLRAGVALCARAAFLCHIDALRELGHCLQDGYGVRQNIAEGRRFLIQANARELSLSAANVLNMQNLAWTCSGCPLLSDFGCNVPVAEPHVASKFLVDWFVMMQEKRLGVMGLRMCSHKACGRPETRRHEFRRCSVCGNVNYCSRACQALDWKLRHKGECRAVERWGVEEEEMEIDGQVEDALDGGMGS